jgi:hypothetical protein
MNPYPKHYCTCVRQTRGLGRRRKAIKKGRERPMRLRKLLKLSDMGLPAII